MISPTAASKVLEMRSRGFSVRPRLSDILPKYTTEASESTPNGLRGRNGFGGLPCNGYPTIACSSNNTRFNRHCWSMIEMGYVLNELMHISHINLIAGYPTALCSPVWEFLCQWIVLHQNHNTGFGSRAQMGTSRALSTIHRRHFKTAFSPLCLSDTGSEVMNFVT